MRKQIKNIKIGDKVKVYNVANQEFGESVVTHTFKGESDHHYILNDKIKVTGTHPFYVRDKDSRKGYRWTEVKDLKTGDKLMNKSGKVSKVKSIVYKPEGMTIYNIEVKGEHNYFAGGYLVHNKLGSYHGEDDDPGTTRSQLNSKSDLLNTEPVSTAVTSMTEMLDAYNANKEAIGDAQGALNEDGSLVDPDAATTGTGAYADLIASLKDITHNQNKTISDAERDQRKAKLDTIDEQGTNYRAQTKEINAAKLATGMVTAGERLKLDQEVQNTINLTTAQRDAQEGLAESTAEANATAEHERAKAQADLERAKEENEIIMRSEMTKSMDPHTDAFGTAKQEYQDAFQAGKDRMGGDERKNWSSYMRPWTHSKDIKANPEMTDIVPTDKVYNKDAGTGTLNPQKGDNAVDFSADFKTVAGVVNTYKFLKDAQKGIAGAPTDGNDDATKTIADVWSGASDPSDAGLLQTLGPGQQTGISYGDGNADDFIITRCFAGNTWIEVV